MADDATLRQLKRIQTWLAVGALGFALLALAAVGVAATFAWTVSFLEADTFSEGDREEAAGETFLSIAKRLFEKGEHEALVVVLAERAESHPHDPDVYWTRARLRAVRGEWDGALVDLRRTALLAPNWIESHIRPFEAEIRARRDGDGGSSRASPSAG